ncbi:MAG: ABC transporter substrate-binding protein [Lachnospiraceae bacterium]
MKKKIARILGMVCMATMIFAGCASNGADNTQTGGAEETKQETTTENVTTESAATEAVADDVVISVASLKGPTSIGMVKMMKDNDGSYDFNIYTAADEIVPLVVNGSVDVASIPANLAAVLYKKTEGKIAVMDVNTLGVLYVVSFDEKLTSIEDLKGKTVYMTGKGTTPEFALNKILADHNMSAADMTLEFKAESTEIIAALKGDKNAVAVIPQPFVTSAKAQLEGLQVNISLAKEWPDMLTGVTIVNKEFAKAHPQAVEKFLADQKASVDYVNANAEEMSVVVEEYDIVKAAIAKQAIPYCNLVFIEGDEMKAKLSNYLQVLYEQEPSSVGGQLPGDDFYFNAQ